MFLQSRKDTPIREQPVGSPQSQRAAAGFLNGMGLLASVVCFLYFFSHYFSLTHYF